MVDLDSMTENLSYSTNIKVKVYASFYNGPHHQDFYMERLCWAQSSVITTDREGRSLFKNFNKKLNKIQETLSF